MNNLKKLKTEPQIYIRGIIKLVKNSLKFLTYSMKKRMNIITEKADTGQAVLQHLLIRIQAKFINQLAGSHQQSMSVLI